METIPFRDVLWGSVYKLGIDPARKLLKDQAESVVSYINAWVRRLYPSADMPAWTKIEARTPDVRHIVSYERGNGSLPPMERIFRVYLTDPDEEGTATDTPFRLMDSGVHVGFEHGTAVWIKFIEQAPRYTSEEWDVTKTYLKDGLCYSPVMGECFKSKINSNTGNDPFARLGQPLATEVIQPAVAPNPALPGQPKQMTVQLRARGFGALPLDPLPTGQFLEIDVLDVDNNLIASAEHTSDGTDESLASCAADLAAQLVANPSLSSFTIGSVADTVTFSDLSDFGLAGSWLRVNLTGGSLIVTQQQAYIPETPATDGQPELIKVTITEQQVSRGSVFTVTVIDALGASHVFSYVALVNDTAVQVLEGLSAALATESLVDDVLSAVHSSIDVPGKSITFSSPTNVGLDASFEPAASPFWELVPFPLDLADQVMRGAYADLLKEQGQTDKGSAEEQAVPTEQAAKVATFTSQQYDALTDQERPRSRYKVT